MKPIIIEVSKDKKGREWVTLTREELEAAIDNAYDAGIMDGRKNVYSGFSISNETLEAPPNGAEEAQAAHE